ncbi:hypothetical protein [Microbacterium sp. Mcb102]|uniref:hypothetical protein n=1 Tax=Microbacterium sp. Mcb102 TaxID=2926012 RepID=UPI0021C7294A|nr:hypothetical protein [Microbacterium sp. Mcb102]
MTGIGGETWPGPVSRKGRGAALSSANDDDILARVGSAGKRALYLRPTIACARIFSAGAMMCAQAVATEFGEAVEVSGLPKFFDV